MDTLAAERSLEALRCGAVPSTAIEEITLLPGPILTTCRRFISRSGFGSGRLVIEGEYGYGKTHTLRYLESRALRFGFAVSFVEIEEPVRASRFHRLYNGLINSMQVPDLPGFTGLGSLVHEWLGSPALQPILLRATPRWPLETALRILAECESGQVHEDAAWGIAQTIWGWVSGEPITAFLARRAILAAGHVPPSAVKLYDEDFRALINPLARLLTSLGYSGWLILVDEAENMTRPGTSILTRANAFKNLDFFLSLKSERSAVACAMTPQARLDIESDLEMHPWSYGTPHFKQGRVYWTKPKSPLVHGTDDRVTLTPFGGEQLMELGRRVRRLHSKAYDWNPASRIKDVDLQLLVDRATNAISNPIRSYLREVVDLLDIALEYPEFRAASLKWLG